MTSFVPQRPPRLWLSNPARCPEGDTHKGGRYGRGMAAKRSRHIALTGPLAQFVERQVSAGEYASASEMIRAARNG